MATLMTNELYSVVDAKLLDGMRVLVSFDNGVSGVFDCSYLVKDKYWEKLKSPMFFSQVRAECGTP